MTRPASSIITLPEYGTAVVDCSEHTAFKMHTDKHVSVSPAGRAGRYEIRAKHKVGVLRYDELEVRIEPKLPVSRLLYLATFHDDPSAWRDLDAAMDEAPDLLSSVGWALVHHAERCLRPTPLQGYVTREESHRYLRGRILFERQLNKNAGLALPVQLRYDEYEVNIVENRVVKAALTLVLRAGGPTGLSQRLRHLCGLLDGVDPWPRGMPVPNMVFTRLNERYRPAVTLARLLLDGRSLEFGNREAPGTAFLLNMNRVFEAYLETALSAALERFGGLVQAQAPVTLDEAGQISMNPDLAWRRDGTWQAVIDAKYKRATHADFPNADAYQMLAYCTALGLRRGHLVYADLDGGPPQTFTVRSSGTELEVSALDLSLDVEALRTEIQQLATRIANSVSDHPSAYHLRDHYS